MGFSYIRQIIKYEKQLMKYVYTYVYRQRIKCNQMHPTTRFFLRIDSLAVQNTSAYFALNKGNLEFVQTCFHRTWVFQTLVYMIEAHVYAKDPLIIQEDIDLTRHACAVLSCRLL